MNSNNVVFLILFIILAFVLIMGGVISRKWVKESSDFILAGREVSTLVNTFGVCALGFAGTTIALAPGFSILLGLRGSILWGVFYTILGVCGFGLLYSNFIRRCGAQTLPEYLEMRYNSKVRGLISITSIVGMTGILANNIVSCVQSIASYTGWNQNILLAVIFLIILTFTVISGMWAATINDFIQVCIGIVAIPLLLSLLANRYGGFPEIAANWPGGDFIGQGLGGASLPGLALTYPSVLNFFVCFAMALVWGNNYFWMKIAISRSEKTARKSLIFGGIIMACVFFIPLAIVGAYVGGFHGEMFVQSGGELMHTAAYGFIARTFVPILGSFFLVGAVAASISTASSSALGATSVATRDIYQRMINPKADAKKTLRASKIAMLCIGVFTWVLCQFPGGPTYLFAFANCWLVPPAILLALGALWPRFGSRGATFGAISGMGVMALFTLLELTGVFVINNYIYFATLGFVVTLVVAVLVTLTEKPKYYGRKGWERVPTASNRIEVELDELDYQILGLLRVGHRYMVEITDTLGLDSATTGKEIEKLDQGGYIIRAGLNRSKFYTFELSEKGKDALPPMEETEAVLAKEKLTPMYIELLEILKNRPGQQAEFIKKHGVKSMHMAAISYHLTREGYIKEKGLFKRKLRITEKGLQAVERYAV